MKPLFIRKSKPSETSANVPNSPLISIKVVRPFSIKCQKSNGRPQELCPAGHMDEPYPTLHIDEVIHSTQVTLPKESDQLRLHRHSASAPGATLLTLTSSSTLDRSRYLRSQINSGYIATRPQRPEPRCSP